MGNPYTVPRNYYLNQLEQLQVAIHSFLVTIYFRWRAPSSKHVIVLQIIDQTKSLRYIPNNLYFVLIYWTSNKYLAQKKMRLTIVPPN